MDSRKYLTEPLDGAACPPYSEATCQPGRTPGRDAGGPRSGAKEGRRPWLGRRVKLRLSLLLAGPASGEALGAAAGASPSFLLPFACAVYPRPASQRRRADRGELVGCEDAAEPVLDRAQRRSAGRRCAIASLTRPPPPAPAPRSPARGDARAPRRRQHRRARCTRRRPERSRSRP